jgi:hypothetical protein
MAHPLRASRAPSRGLSLDAKGSVNLSGLAKGWSTMASAASMAHQQTGRAGSVVFAGSGCGLRKAQCFAAMES